MPPAAMHEGACDERQVVMGAKTVQMRPNRVEVAPRHECVMAQEGVGVLRAEGFLIEKDDDVHKYNKVSGQWRKRDPDRIFYRKHDVRPGSKRLTWSDLHIRLSSSTPRCCQPRKAPFTPPGRELLNRIWFAPSFARSLSRLLLYVQKSNNGQRLQDGEARSPA